MKSLMPELIIAWKDVIVNALDQENNAMPGRAGETPLSDLAGEFSQILEPMARHPAIEALRELVVNPDIVLINQDERGYWSGISFLTRHLPGKEKESLQPAFRSKLFNKEARERGLSVFALHGFIGTGGRLEQADLERLTEIKERAPVAWLGAAVASGLHEFAHKNAIELLSERKVNLTTFLMGLDAWRESWGSHGDFVEILPQLYAAVPDHEEKEKFTRWLERRGIFSLQP